MKRAAAGVASMREPQPMPWPRVERWRHVLIITALATLFATAVPVGLVALLLSGTPLPAPQVFGWLLFTGAIPALLTPPLALVLLHLLRMLTITVGRLDQLIKFDVLTGAFSRAYFLDQVRRALPGGGAVLAIDVDHFKAINDTHGHDVGDQALRSLSHAMSTACPGDALLGRLGGDEFAVFLAGADGPGLRAAGTSILEAVGAAPFVLPTGSPLRLTISLGGAVHDPRWSIEATLKLADLRLYEAKRSGRNRCVVSERDVAHNPGQRAGARA